MISFIKFQDFYWDGNGESVTFYVGRLKSIVFSTNNDLDTTTSIFVWAYNDLSTPRFKLVGAESSDGKTVEKAKRIVHILNRKAKNIWFQLTLRIEGLSEDDEFQIMSSSKKDNSKFN